MLTTITILVFVIVTIGVFVIGSLVDQRRARARLLRDRLTAVQKPAEREPGEEVALLRDELLSEIPALDTLLRKSERISSLQKLLSQGAIDVRAGNYLLICLGCAVFVGTIAFVWSNYQPFVAWAGGLIGFFLPYSYAAHQRTKRFATFEELFPQAIDTLARAVRAGHAFVWEQSFARWRGAAVRSGRRRPHCRPRQRFGLPVRDALANLSDRVPLVDVKFFVTAVMLQRETGGNLAEILDNLSYVIRERFKIQRQVRVYTAQGRLTMLLLMGLPPLIILVMRLMNPAFIQPLFSDPLGHALLVVGITLQTVGYFIIRRIIQIQV